MPRRGAGAADRESLGGFNYSSQQNPSKKRKVVENRPYTPAHAYVPMDTVAVQVPAGMRPGMEMSFQTASGQVYKVVIPPNTQPGHSLTLQVPSTAPPPPTRPAPPPTPPDAVPMGIAISPAEAAAPPRLAFPAASSTVASKHAECPISFEPLCKGPVGVFLNAAGHRTSPHFFSLEAAQEWVRAGNGMCPLTRVPVASVLPVPDIRTDPEGWFRAVDINGDGRLSRAEAIECLKAQLPVDNAALDAAAADPSNWMWQTWDVDGSGFIEKAELFAPQGLLASVQAMFSQTGRPSEPPPIADKERWYEFWDEECAPTPTPSQIEPRLLLASPHHPRWPLSTPALSSRRSGSGTLEREEVVRALLKTLRLGTDQAKVQQMRQTVEAIWAIFDEDGSDSIDRAELMRPGEGLADTIIATLQYS